MFTRIICPPCTGSGLDGNERCHLCIKDRGHLNLGQPRIPLAWFMEPTVLPWARHVKHILALQIHALECHRDVSLLDSFGRSLTLANYILEGHLAKPGEDDRWFVAGGRIVMTTQAAVTGYQIARATLHINEFRKALPSAFTFVETKVPKQVSVASAGDADGWRTSSRIAGLEFRLERDRGALAFRFADAVKLFNLRTGQCIEGADEAPYPEAIAAYVCEAVNKHLPPHIAKLSPSPTAA